MSFPRYPKYKPSGVEWLGDVPEGWEIKRLRFVADLNPSKSELAELERDTLVSFLPMEAVGDDGTLTLDKEKTIAELETGYTYFRDGDVTIAKITPCYENGKGALMRGLTNGIGFGTTELIVARPMPSRITGTYLHYIFISLGFRGIGESHMYGAGGQKRVPDAFVRNFATAIPPLAEQTAIAEFLDRETGKIDELVAEQRRLMELLKEKRQAVISHAVTKGLNPHARMKPSGIEWPGDVPEEWEVIQIKQASKLESGHTPSRQHPEYWENCTIPWFTLADVWQIRDAKAEYLFDTKEKVSALGLANSSARLLPKHTVILSRTASVGFSGIMAVDMATTQDFANWICGPHLKPEFLLYALRAMDGEFRRLMMGSTHHTIYMPDIKSLRFGLPPMDQQAEIVAYIRDMTREFDTLTAEAQRAIDLLQERRAALISAAVTGQIDVRHPSREP